MQEHIKNYLPKLFKKLTNPNDINEENKNEIIKTIKKFDETITSNNYDNSLSYFQNVILAKMMISWVEKNISVVELSGDYNKLYTKYFDFPKYDEFEIEEEEKNLFYDLGLDVKGEIDDFFSSLIINFLKQKENSKAKIIKMFWNEINLFNYEINDKIKEELRKHMEKDKFYEELYKDNKLFESEKSNILKEIYYFYDFKTIEKTKIETLKDYADKERQTDDFGRMLQINEPDSHHEKKSFVDEVKEKEKKKMPSDKLKQVLNKWIIEIDLQHSNNKELNSYYYYKKGEIKEIIELYKYGEYNCKIIEEKNYVQYLNFNDKVEKFIMDNFNNIKKKGKICLELTKKCKQQNGEQFKEDQKDLYAVDCESYFKKNDEDDYDQNIGKFKDDNVLINGISGENLGFIFLVNELCNDDYDNKK